MKFFGAIRAAHILDRGIVEGDYVDSQPEFEQLHIKKPIDGNTQYDVCIAQIIYIDAFNQTAFGDYEFESDSRNASDTTLILKTKYGLPCIEELKIEDLQIAQNTTKQQRNVAIEDLKNFFNKTDRLKYPLNITFSLKNCSKGEYLDPNTIKCQPCPSNFFSFDESFFEPSACSSCLQENFYCYGGFQLSPKKNYWRRDSYSTNFLRCLIPSGNHQQFLIKIFFPIFLFLIMLLNQ